MFEIKIACSGKSWKDTPVFVTGDEAVFSYDASEQFRLAMHIAQHLADMFHSEVRWNWQGSQQSHYVSPKDTTGCEICPGCEIMRDCPAEYHKEVNHVTATLTSEL